ncbi:hypothetical protein CLG96_11845 [Sphingomonas oleivorans]|uniref:General secretion pathway protein N n=1 Tax=Sphingomonas oleivorans TaxID=1735121 RepID=A0A2T5FVR2_9SPHN|nr:hypothetical protein CLG96_11845 [Sphingomonas oleivorans]
MPGGARLGWRWAPLRSIARLGFALDWQTTGPGSDVAGQALIRADGVLLEQVSGQASGALLAAIAPDLPFSCDMPLNIDLRRAAIGGKAQGFTGQILSDAGTCGLKAGGVATAVAPLVAIAAQGPDQGSELTLAPQGQRRRKLIEGSVSPEGHLRLRVTADGAEALPFASTPGGLVLETNL